MKYIGFVWLSYFLQITFVSFFYNQHLNDVQLVGGNEEKWRCPTNSCIDGGLYDGGISCLGDREGEGRDLAFLAWET